MRKIIGFISIIVCTGCSGTSVMNQDFTMTGSVEGIRAFNDGISGIARTAKEHPEQPSEYMATRIKQEAEITKRALKPSVLDGLFVASKGGAQ